LAEDAARALIEAVPYFKALMIHNDDNNNNNSPVSPSHTGPLQPLEAGNAKKPALLS
jgi:hypothetical protein